LAVTDISSSGNISGSKFYGNGANLTGLPSAAISSYTNASNNRLVTSVDSSTVNAEANLSFDGNKLSATGQISASLGVTGSSLNTAATVINATHISSSLNVSGAAFFGSGAGLTGLPSAAISTYTNSGDNRIITSVNSSTVNAEASLTFDGSKLAVVGAISGSGLLESVGGAVLGGALLVTGSITGGASISGSGVISGKDLVIDDGRRIGIASDTDLMVLTDSQLRIKGTLTASAPIQGRSLTVAGGEVISKNGALGNITSATIGGPISGSGTLEAVGAAILGNTLSVTGSITSATSLGTATTIINSTHVSSSLNISGANFYGNGSNLSGLPSATVTSYTNSSNNRVLTSVDSETINGEANLTFDGNKLSATGQISASLGISGSKFMGDFFEGKTFETATTFINATHVSSSLNISGAAFFGSGAGLTGLPSAAITSYTNASNNRIITSVDSDTVNSEANLTFDGNKLSATGQISASLGVSGSRFIGVTFEGSGFETSTTFINSTHVSSSLNISGAAFYGDGSNLSGISAGGSSAYNSYTLNFTVTDSHDILGIVTTGSAITASLPTAATFDAGQKIIFKDVSGSCSGSNHIVISASQNHAGEKIDGQGVVKIETGYGALTLASDGVKSYYIVSTS
jgi:azurin